MSAMHHVEERLKELGLELPPPTSPSAEYVSAKCFGKLLFLSGQGPIRNGQPVMVGQVGGEISLEQGVEAAQLSALNALSAIKAAIGSFDRVEGVVQLRGFVNSAPGFYSQLEVMNGASKLLVAVFGEAGRHVRCALGTSSLPRNIPVELEMIVALNDSAD